jgi:hypothetical protein
MFVRSPALRWLKQALWFSLAAVTKVPVISTSCQARHDGSAIHAAASRLGKEAYRDYGRGQHPAALNSGDCFTQKTLLGRCWQKARISRRLISSWLAIELYTRYRLAA